LLIRLLGVFVLISFDRADFGFAAAADQALSTECGTRSYMAPEMFARRPYLGPATDGTRHLPSHRFNCPNICFL
jgi:serine/threonine protein kinase